MSRYLNSKEKKDSISSSEIDESVKDSCWDGGPPLTDGRSKRLIAYHEVGHALIGSLVKAHDPVQKVTVIPRGQAKGLTWFLQMMNKLLLAELNSKLNNGCIRRKSC